jgi:hypothetical protein
MTGHRKRCLRVDDMAGESGGATARCVDRRRDAQFGALTCGTARRSDGAPDSATAATYARNCFLPALFVLRHARKERSRKAFSPGVSTAVPWSLDLPGELVADGPRGLDLTPHARGDLKRRRKGLLETFGRSSGRECPLRIALEQRQHVTPSGDGWVGHFAYSRCNACRRHYPRGLRSK